MEDKLDLIAEYVGALATELFGMYCRGDYRGAEALEDAELDWAVCDYSSVIYWSEKANAFVYESLPYPTEPGWSTRRGRWTRWDEPEVFGPYDWEAEPIPW